MTGFRFVHLFVGVDVHMLVAGLSFFLIFLSCCTFLHPPILMLTLVLVRSQVVLVDLMGGKGAEPPVTSTALPSRPNYWIILSVQWHPQVTGPPGRDYVVKWTKDLYGKLVALDNELAGMLLLVCLLFMQQFSVT
jgi:hypothetical protein